MEVSDLKDLFFILGVLVSIVFVLGIIMISVIKLHDFIAECKYAKRYEYMINHRFDDPPLAKCYCIDCKYCYGEPTKTGGNVYCSLWNSGIIIQDNSFCYRAEPKERKRNDSESRVKNNSFSRKGGQNCDRL